MQTNFWGVIEFAIHNNSGVEVFFKLDFWNILQSSLKQSCFYSKVASLGQKLYCKWTASLVFSQEFYVIFQNSYSFQQL